MEASGDDAVTPGELRCLLERCRADDTTAWEEFAHWVRVKGTGFLRAIRRLSKADRDDIVATALKQLLRVVRNDGISGSTNAEIHAYVRATIRHQALDLLRSRAHLPEGPDPRGAGSVPRDAQDGDVADLQPSQEARAITSQQLARLSNLLESWTAAERYLFIAKVKGVSTRTIQQTLAQPPFNKTVALSTVDTRFHRLRKSAIDHLEQP